MWEGAQSIVSSQNLHVFTNLGAHHISLLKSFIELTLQFSCPLPLGQWVELEGPILYHFVFLVTSPILR